MPATDDSLISTIVAGAVLDSTLPSLTTRDAVREK
jgi:hypothetical protein